MVEKDGMGDLGVKELSIGEGGLGWISGRESDRRVFLEEGTVWDEVREATMSKRGRGPGGVRAGMRGGPPGGKSSATVGADVEAEPAPGLGAGSGVGWPGWARGVATAVLVFHLAALLAGALGVPPSSELERAIADGFSPYFDLMDLGYSYR